MILRLSAAGAALILSFFIPLDVQAFDPNKPVELESSYFKMKLSQDHSEVSENEFREALDTLPEAEDLMDSAKLYWNFAQATILGGPLMLIYGVTTNQYNYQTGQTFMAYGAVITAGSLWLLHAAAKNRKEAVQIYNRDRTEEKPTPRMWMSPILASGSKFDGTKNGIYGIQIGREF